MVSTTVQSGQISSGLLLRRGREREAFQAVGVGLAESTWDAFTTQRQPDVLDDAIKNAHYR